MTTQESYRFSRLSENQRVYLISIRKEKVIPAHGSKFHFRQKRHENSLLEEWWHLFPASYYIFEHVKSEKRHKLHKVLIKKEGEDFIEEHQPIEYVPHWLYTLLTSLPEFSDEHFKNEHKIYIPGRRLAPSPIIQTEGRK